jgi:Protein of unknown function (DUF2948)
LLHLTALDAEDLPAISAQLQDAVVRFGDMAYTPKRRQFAFVSNRFAWDALPEKQRRRAGLRINYVTSAKRSSPAKPARDTILSLLAITFMPTAKDDPAGTLTLDFAGGHRIALAVECVDIQLDDLGGTWSAKSEPHHET